MPRAIDADGQMRRQMKLRALVLVAMIVAVAGVGCRLMAASGERAIASSESSVAASSFPDQIAPPLPPIDEPARDPEASRPTSPGIDCTRGVACPIIYAPPKGR
jgi:hypothetical protein